MLGKKASSGMDLIYVAIALFTLSLIVYLCYTMLLGIQTAMTNSGQFQANALGMFASYVTAIAAWDYVFAIVLAGLIILTLVSGWFVDVHPVMFVISVLLYVATNIIAVALSNTFEVFQNNPSLVDASTTFTIINHVMQYLPYYMLLFFLVYVVALFGKPRTSNTGGTTFGY